MRALPTPKVSIEANNFAHVQSYVAKAEGAPEMQEKSLVQAKLRCASALAMLDTNNQNKYKQAARMLLETSFEIGSNYNEVGLGSEDVWLEKWGRETVKYEREAMGKEGRGVLKS